RPDALPSLTSTCTRTYTWQAVTAPVFAADSGCGSTTPLGCNPPSIPTCGTATPPTASNECGPVNVTCEAVDAPVSGCNHSRTLTFTATACGLTSTPTRTYTCQAVTAPVRA